MPDFQLLICGRLTIVIGSRFAVNQAVIMARQYRLSDEIIGILILSSGINSSFRLDQAAQGREQGIKFKPAATGRAGKSRVGSIEEVNRLNSDQAGLYFSHYYKLREKYSGRTSIVAR